MRDSLRTDSLAGLGRGMEWRNGLGSEGREWKRETPALSSDDSESPRAACYVRSVGATEHGELRITLRQGRHVNPPCENVLPYYLSEHVLRLWLWRQVRHGAGGAAPEGHTRRNASACLEESKQFFDIRLWLQQRSP